MDWKTARLIRNKAFDDIYKDPDLWREWNLAKTQQDRDLMINYVIFTTSFDEGYTRGYDEGGNEAMQTANCIEEMKDG